MRFMLQYGPRGKIDGPPTTKVEEEDKAGVLIESDGLQPTSNGTRVRISGKKFFVTDGPFAETKELIAG